MDEVLAFATAGLRQSENRQQFVDSVKRKAGIDIQIISGSKEAQLIFHGAKQTFELEAQNVLIMDIGGGSIEFIICNLAGIKWKVKRMGLSGGTSR